MKRTNGILLAISAFAVSASGQGTILWNESINGSLSHFSDNPTGLGLFQLGTNSVIGSTEIEPNGDNWIVYDDFFTFAIPANALVTSIFFQVDKPDVQTWIGDPSFFNQFAVVRSPDSGAMLPQWGLSALSSGSYGMYLANHDAQSFTSIANYRLDFFIQAIPEPSTLALALAAAAGFGVLHWTRISRRQEG